MKSDGDISQSFWTGNKRTMARGTNKPRRSSGSFAAGPKKAPDDQRTMEERLQVCRVALDGCSPGITSPLRPTCRWR